LPEFADAATDEQDHRDFRDHDRLAVRAAATRP
jgi:hypothetical protein